MNILVTGSNGFIGKNLVAELKNEGFTDNGVVPSRHHRYNKAL